METNCRIAVLDRNKRLVGIASWDFALRSKDEH
jgi:hypothetical protein